MAKQLLFDTADRSALQRGVDQLANAVKVTLGPKGRNVVIAKAKVTTTALRNAASIAGLLLTTECLVAEKKESRPQAGRTGGMGLPDEGM